MDKKVEMGKLGEELFKNFCLHTMPGSEVEYHHYEYALYWDAKVYWKNDVRFYQVKTGAPYVSKDAGVLHLSQQEKYIKWMDDPTVDGGDSRSRFSFLSFPCEGPERYNQKIQKNWLGKVYCLKPSVMKKANSEMFNIQDRGSKKEERYIIPYKENYNCIFEDLHLLPENVKIYEDLKYLSSSKYK